MRVQGFDNAVFERSVRNGAAKPTFAPFVLTGTRYGKAQWVLRTISRRIRKASSEMQQSVFRRSDQNSNEIYNDAVEELTGTKENSKNDAWYDRAKSAGDSMIDIFDKDLYAKRKDNLGDEIRAFVAEHHRFLIYLSLNNYIKKSVCSGRANSFGVSVVTKATEIDYDADLEEAQRVTNTDADNYDYSVNYEVIPLARDGMIKKKKKKPVVVIELEDDPIQDDFGSTTEEIIDPGPEVISDHCNNSNEHEDIELPGWPRDRSSNEAQAIEDFSNNGNAGPELFGNLVDKAKGKNYLRNKKQQQKTKAKKAKQANEEAAAVRDVDGDVIMDEFGSITEEIIDPGTEAIADKHEDIELRDWFKNRSSNNTEIIDDVSNSGNPSNEVEVVQDDASNNDNPDVELSDNLTVKSKDMNRLKNKRLQRKMKAKKAKKEKLRLTKLEEISHQDAAEASAPEEGTVAEATQNPDTASTSEQVLVNDFEAFKTEDAIVEQIQQNEIEVASKAAHDSSEISGAESDHSGQESQLQFMQTEGNTTHTIETEESLRTIPKKVFSVKVALPLVAAKTTKLNSATVAQNVVASEPTNLPEPAPKGLFERMMDIGKEPWLVFGDTAVFRNAGDRMRYYLGDDGEISVGEKTIPKKFLASKIPVERKDNSALQYGTSEGIAAMLLPEENPRRENFRLSRSKSLNDLTSESGFDATNSLADVPWDLVVYEPQLIISDQSEDRLEHPTSELNHRIWTTPLLEILDQAGQNIVHFLGENKPLPLTISDHEHCNKFLDPSITYNCAYCKSVTRENPATSEPVICPRCGPCSNIRYCTKQCLLADSLSHFWHCGHTSGTYPMEWTSIPEKYHQLMPAMLPLGRSPTANLPISISQELHRQMTYSMVAHEGPVGNPYSAWFLFKLPAEDKMDLVGRDHWRPETYIKPGDYFIFHPMCEDPGLLIGRVGFILMSVDFGEFGVEEKSAFNRVLNALFCTHEPPFFEFVLSMLLDYISKSELSDLKKNHLSQILHEQLKKEFSQIPSAHFPAAAQFDFHHSWQQIEEWVNWLELQYPMLRLWCRDMDTQYKNFWARFTDGVGWNHRDPAFVRGTPSILPYGWIGQDENIWKHELTLRYSNQCWEMMRQLGSSHGV
jgi:hypothetical protein